MRKIWRDFVEGFILKHPALFSAVVIYLYYLFTTLDLFKKGERGDSVGFGYIYAF
ncbi:hypothetical protein [Candidatus Kryptonium thompsonii]|uniref:hypothetical protein n=1 Tax=Candidatus Kryptonium thompsonii TaxID=1633631 RepID=UPI000707D5AA|nr:hypothetical protein [Candidatus Kryptonium thompsoni]CUS87479.1 hypothetical protein JGI12_01064 [Candidatus Kryptonium thompsoni]